MTVDADGQRIYAVRLIRRTRTSTSLIGFGVALILVGMAELMLAWAQHRQELAALRL